jgi:hypothetical protein
MPWPLGKGRIDDGVVAERRRLTVTISGPCARLIERLAVKWECSEAEVFRRLLERASALVEQEEGKAHAG